MKSSDSCVCPCLATRDICIKHFYGASPVQHYDNFHVSPTSSEPMLIIPTYVFVQKYVNRDDMMVGCVSALMK